MTHIKSSRELYKTAERTIVGNTDVIHNLCDSTSLQEVKSECFEKDDPVPNINSNLLIIGSSGSGKTASVKAVTDQLKIPCIIVNSPEHTASGWKGKNLSETLYSELKRYIINETYSDYSSLFSIIVMDEFDKSLTGMTEYAASSILPDLLKLMDGTVLGGEKTLEPTINTEHFLWIFLGAFSGIEEIIRKRLNAGKSSLGFGSELIGKPPPSENIISQVTMDDIKDYDKTEITSQWLGRLHKIVTTDPLTEDTFRNILLKGENNIISQFDLLFKRTNRCHVTITEDAATALARKAMQQPEIGTRALNNLVSDILIPQINILSNDKRITGLCISTDSLGEPCVEYSRDKTVIPGKKQAHPKQISHLDQTYDWLSDDDILY